MSIAAIIFIVSIISVFVFLMYAADKIREADRLIKLYDDKMTNEEDWDAISG